MHLMRTKKISSLKPGINICALNYKIHGEELYELQFIGSLAFGINSAVKVGK